MGTHEDGTGLKRTLSGGTDRREDGRLERAGPARAMGAEDESPPSCNMRTSVYIGVETPHL